MNFENLEKYYAMNNLKKTRYFQQGLQRLIKYKRLKAILIDHYDYLYCNLLYSNNRNDQLK